MGKINEITVFASGNSKDIRTWSNVPYFFTETLLTKGIKVNRVDLSPSSFLKGIFNLTIKLVINRINKDTTYNYFRSFTHFNDVKNRIKKALKQFPDSDANVFLTFSFSSAGLTSKPSIQFCDWTYDHYLKYFKNRKPDFLEKQCIRREDLQIEGSDLVFSLFPGIAGDMRKRYKNPNIQYLGNVINSLIVVSDICLLYTSPSPRDRTRSRMPSSA